MTASKQSLFTRTAVCFHSMEKYQDGTLSETWKLFCSKAVTGTPLESQTNRSRSPPVSSVGSGDEPLFKASA